MKPINNSIASSTQFHHIAIKCVDFDKSKTFYTETLGMNAALQWGEGDGRGCMMDIGGGTYIEIFAGGIKTEAPENSVIHFCILVEDCDLYYNRAMEAGCKSKDTPFDLVINAKEKDLPIRIAFIYGPDNEVIEFFQYR
ncbi:VOC family protein [Oceanispirochaeta sp.]|uniref:VOC family protein n=1 Tax=Oceanispirochaeta sp. TaxID=2035350 RepID=UPI0026112BEE|nr:VOC family protein [Oceanispirochaeta sp.]MDA3957503.1 VOC family protein [Oceanispirochaeta sp.]